MQTRPTALYQRGQRPPTPNADRTVPSGSTPRPAAPGQASAGGDARRHRASRLRIPRDGSLSDLKRVPVVVRGDGDMSFSPRPWHRSVGDHRYALDQPAVVVPAPV